MTEAEPRRAAKLAGRAPVSAPVLWTGLALGTFLAVTALGHGVMLPWFGGFADAVLTFVLLLAAGVALAELARRHHRAAARHAIRHGRRGASAAYRGARRHGGRGAGFVAGKARARWEGWRAAPQQEAPADEQDWPPLSGEWGVPGPDAPPEPAHQSPNPTGGTTVTSNGTKQPAVRARRTASGTGVPAEWNGVVAGTADFQAESDGDLLNWMGGQVAGVAAWAEALVEQHETCLAAIGVDPVAIASLHDVADAAVHAAETMAAARKRFADHYELPTEFVANGGLLAHDGRWHKGDAD
jgi:hypothetical protein